MGEYNTIIKKNTFYAVQWQDTLGFLFFKPKGSRLANQAIVGIHFVIATVKLNEALS